MSIDGFLSSLDCARPLLGAPEVSAAWDELSALADLTVGALTAHMVSAVAGVETFLDLPVPHGVVIADLSSYYGHKKVPASLREALNAHVADAARPGPTAVLARFDEVRNSLGSKLLIEPSNRVMRIPSRESPRGDGPGGRYMRLDDFLVTRTMEVVVHSDDLAASVSLQAPTFSDATNDAVIGLIVETCRRRHGDAAVIRAFTRRERDTGDTLRVF